MLVLALMRVFGNQTALALGMSARRNKRPVRFWYMRSPAVAENRAALALTPASRRARLDLMRAHFFTSGAHIGR
jgi:hypothetical protein